MKNLPLLIFLCFFNRLLLSQIAPLEYGLVFKIGLIKSGVYKIDGSYLRKSGIDISKINPKNIHVFGNGAGMLPQINAAKRPEGLIENAILLVGENDNKFDATDYILFFGEGPHKTNYNITNQSISQKTHLYSDSSFYFLIFNNLPGLRVENSLNELTKTGETIGSFDDYYYHELEQRNINGNRKIGESGKSGREWFGEELSENTTLNRIFDLKISNVVPNSKVQINTGVVGATQNGSSNFNVFINDKLIQQIETEAIYSYEYGANGAFNSQKKEFQIENPSNLKVEIKLLDSPDNYTLGYLDYFGIQIKRNLIFEANQFQFTSFESTINDYSIFQIKNNEPIIIWDITNPHKPKNQLYTIQNGSSFTTYTKNILKNFQIFSEKSFFTIGSIKKIPNQNLRAYNSPELLIVTTKKFKAAAQKLADHRAINDKIISEVVDIEEIYNEFSSGMVDVTAIRDFAKFLYDKHSNKLKYLLIFADASYDIRNKEGDLAIKKILPDLIPAYQSYESLDNVKSYSSEDYYGFLENHEGEWLETLNNDDNHTLDIGVGRIPVKTTEEADGVVEKLIYYDSKQNTLGNWRTKIALTSDDGDYNMHQNDSEDLAEIVKIRNNNFRPEKIYVDAFPRLSGNLNGKLSPEGSKKISNTFKEGALIFNYIGHGGVKNLSDEKILTREDLASWRNIDNMPLMVTATCQFGRYDDAGEISGAEKAILNPNGGAIALLTTTRPVYSNSNKSINEAFYKAVFEPVNGSTPRLGDILMATKNNSFEYVNNRNFTLLGDPSMKLAYPEHKIAITKINKITVSEKIDTLRALEKVEIEGEIKDYKENNLLQKFTGKVTIKIFDKETTLRTLGNNANLPMNYKEYNDKIFESEATVKNGVFKISFIIPKDIQYKYGKGRIEMYAYNDSKDEDAFGIFNSFVIGGSQNTIISDKNPPIISAYLNEPEFKNGNTVSQNPILFANLKDDNGININQSAIGHEILAVLDGKTNFILNNYISPVLDNPKEYNLKFQFQKLSIGNHKLVFTAWDIYNNSYDISLEFVVKESKSGQLNNFFNFPNPVIDNTSLSIDHNFIDENLNANISVFNLSGKLIKSLTYNIIEAESPLIINLPIKSLNFGVLSRGIYPIAVELKSEKSNKTASGASKLIVID